MSKMAENLKQVQEMNILIQEILGNVKVYSILKILATVVKT